MKKKEVNTEKLIVWMVKIPATYHEGLFDTKEKAVAYAHKMEKDLAYWSKIEEIDIDPNNFKDYTKEELIKEIYELINNRMINT